MKRTAAVVVRTVVLAGVLVAMGHAATWAESLRVLPPGEKPQDRRLGPLKDLNGYCPFHVPETPQQWKARREYVRRQVLVSQGLWPLPPKTPLNAVIHSRRDMGDYTIEKVYFESLPGFYVTGNLYRPKNIRGKVPAVACPHGHWADGRFHDAGLKRVRQQIARGEERFEQGGRSPLQARCVQLARMGCVVFHWDMIGYADSVQLAHRPGVREHMNTMENWGFFSPQAELRLQNMMGLQTWNSIRSLDFLLSLPEVDPQRIGVTGASGGGTQTFMLCAVDDRPTVACPAVMVSTAMQGGCSSENAPYLRVGTGNVEIAALFAPRPLALTAANDWTREMPTKGFPELKRLYRLLGAPQNVTLGAFLQFGHNYNSVSRHFMYQWFNRHLKLGLPEPVLERDYQFLTRDELTVWDQNHPAPRERGDQFERRLVRYLTTTAEKQLAALVPHDAKELQEYRRVVGGALEVLLGHRLPGKEELEFKKVQEKDRGDFLLFTGLLRNTAVGSELPVAFLLPKQWNKQVVVWVTEQGKSGLLDAQGRWRGGVRRLLEAGYCVAAADLLYQGEFLSPGEKFQKTRLVGSGRGKWKYCACYTFGYNLPVFSQRVGDLLTLIAFVRHHKQQPEQVHLVGLGAGALWAAAARVLAGKEVDRLAVSTGGFRFRQLNRIDHPHFVPGIVKYGDLPALLALSAPHPTWVAGEGEQGCPLVNQVYRAAGSPGRVVWSGVSAGEAEAAAVAWLLGK